jgi:flagellar hook-length control protein FliK
MIAASLTELPGATEHHVVEGQDDTDAPIPFNEFLAAVASIQHVDQPGPLAAESVTIGQESVAQETVGQQPVLQTVDAASFIPLAGQQVPTAELAEQITAEPTFATAAPDVAVDPIAASITAEIPAAVGTDGKPLTPAHRLTAEPQADNEGSTPQPATAEFLAGEPAVAETVTVEAEHVVQQHQAVTGADAKLDALTAVDQPEQTWRQVASPPPQRSDSNRVTVDEGNLTLDAGSSEVEPLPAALAESDVSSEQDHSSGAGLPSAEEDLPALPQRGPEPPSPTATDMPQAIPNPEPIAMSGEANIERGAAAKVSDNGIASLQGLQPRDITEQVVSAVTQVIESADGPAVKTMFLELNPADLGRLKIQVEQTAESVAAHIIASEIVSSDLLASKKEALLEALSNLGFADASVDISHQESNQSDARRSPWDGQPTLHPADMPPALNQHINVHTSQGLNIVV